MLEKLKTKRILGLVGVIGLILGLFLNYASLEVYYYSYDFILIEYWEGKVIFILTLLNLLYIFKDYVKKYVPKIYENSIGKKVDKIDNPKLLLIPTGIIVALVIYVARVFDLDSSYISFGLGCYLLWIGVVALVAHSFLYKYNNDNAVNLMENNIQFTNGAQMENNMSGSISNNIQFPNSVPMQNNISENNMNSQINNTDSVNKPVYIQSFKVCSFCGNQCELNTSFCPKCGKQV